MKKLCNKPLTILANNPHLAGGLIIFGILLSGIGNVSIMYGSYYRGVNKGVDARDDYYLEKERKAYEENRNKGNS